jgi:hypothetical protein
LFRFTFCALMLKKLADIAAMAHESVTGAACFRA